MFISEWKLYLSKIGYRGTLVNFANLALPEPIFGQGQGGGGSGKKEDLQV